MGIKVHETIPSSQVLTADDEGLAKSSVESLAALLVAVQERFGTRSFEIGKRKK